MKKQLIFLIIFICITATVSSQGFYLDVGSGFGKAWTKVGGKNIANLYSKNLDEIGFDISFKAGYGPFGNIPLFAVVEIGAIFHIIKDELFNGITVASFSSNIVGPGVIFYPIPLIQLGLSLGYSIPEYETEIPYYNYIPMYDFKVGFAWNISAAVDLGKSDHGVLLGIKYFNSISKEKTTNANFNSSFICFFVKYAYRKKV